MNEPYVKKYDDKGTLLNPIIGTLSPKHPTRRDRRPKKVRFHGESKNFHLSVTPYGKFRRLRQVEFDKDGNRKVIEHYLPMFIAKQSKP